MTDIDEFRKQIRNAALEEAAKVVRNYLREKQEAGHHSDYAFLQNIAEQIISLKGAPKA